MHGERSTLERRTLDSSMAVGEGSVRGQELPGG